MSGPVQVLVVGFDDPTFSGEVLNEFDRLKDANIVRLIDVLVVARDDDGAFDTVETPGYGDVTIALLGAPDDGVLDLDGAVETWSLADAVPPGTTAAVALIEHTWAADLRTAVRRAGGAALDETWLGVEDLDRLDDLLRTREFSPSGPRTPPQ